MASAREFAEAMWATAALDNSGLTQDQKDEVVRSGLLTGKQPPAKSDTRTSTKTDRRTR